MSLSLRFNTIASLYHNEKQDCKNLTIPKTTQNLTCIFYSIIYKLSENMNYEYKNFKTKLYHIAFKMI